jgi:2,4-dienoyl-CoA reductase-like NADH-dependent reductase (Old Yellow Enzyme family)
MLSMGSGRRVRCEPEALDALLAPYKLRRLRLANRIVLGPHGTGFVDVESHLPTPRQACYLAERAKGGVGLMQGSIMAHDTGLTGTHVSTVQP